MITITIFIYTMMCYGLSSAIVYYSGPFDIFVKFREAIAYHDKLLELFSCMFCLPTNIGMFMSILSLGLCPVVPFTPFTIIMPHNLILWPLIIIFDGLYTGAMVSIIDAIVTNLEDKGNNNSKMILND